MRNSSVLRFIFAAHTKQALLRLLTTASVMTGLGKNRFVQYRSMANIRYIRSGRSHLVRSRASGICHENEIKPYPEIFQIR